MECCTAEQHLTLFNRQFQTGFSLPGKALYSWWLPVEGEMQELSSFGLIFASSVHLQVTLHQAFIEKAP